MIDRVVQQNGVVTSGFRSREFTCDIGGRANIADSLGFSIEGDVRFGTADEPDRRNLDGRVMAFIG